MNFTAAKALFEEASFITEIRDEADYENALALLEELLEDYDSQRTLIGILTNTIGVWEDTAPAFATFNQRVAQMDDGVAVLRTLIDLTAQLREELRKLKESLESVVA